MEYTETINGSQVKDWDSFHREFQDRMGFFDDYGKNNNAWLDCMTDMYTNGEYQSLTKFNLDDGDRFILRISNAEQWKNISPETFYAFIDLCVFANEERTHFLLDLGKGI